MILVNEIKGRIVAKETTQEKVAKKLGITPRTLNSKLKKGVFDSDEIEKLIDILDIKDPMSIFFAKKVTS